MFVSIIPVAVISVDSPLVDTIVSSDSSEESDTSAIDSSSATVGFEAPADSSLISFVIASSVSGLERVESSSATTAFEIPFNAASTSESILRSTVYCTSPSSLMSVTATVSS